MAEVGREEDPREASRVTVEVPGSPSWSIVLLGRFNPAIFQPAWLAAHKLIRQEEADKAKGVVFSPDIAAFSADWLRMQVIEDRFEATAASEAHAGPLRDLVLGIFALLEHTPFEKMGLNHHGHYPLREAGWQVLDGELVPKEPWTDLLTGPTLRTLIIEGACDGAPGARVQIRVEPSIRIEGGLWVATNEHYERSGPEGGRQLMSLLAARWEGTQAYAKRVVEQLTASRA